MYVCMYVCMYTDDMSCFSGYNINFWKTTTMCVRPEVYVCMYVCMYVYTVCMYALYHYVLQT